MTTVIRLENTTKGSFKFWEALVKPRSVDIRHGRIGRLGRYLHYRFNTAEEAQEFVNKRAAQWLSRGYVRDDHGILVTV